ncbi:MAG: aldose 1-epimerase family protein [Thermoguttaceae bacterium]
MDNGLFRFVVVPTRGMGIWKAALGGIRLGWNSPVKGPVHPSHVNLWEPGGLGWLNGFDELLVRCGLESNGAPEFDARGLLRYPLHGKIANCPAHHVDVSIDGDLGRIEIAGVVGESRLFGSKLRLVSRISTVVGRPGLTVSDAVTNLSAEPGEMELLYHINFGMPLVGPGAKVVLPIVKMAPRDAVAVGNASQWDTYGPESPGTPEAVFFFDLAADSAAQTEVLLHNQAADQGVSLKFKKTELPCFSLWKNRQAAADGYVTGLEPAVNFPNRKSFEKEKGRVVKFAPGETRTCGVSMEVHPTPKSVAEAKQRIARLQDGVQPQILSHPDPVWSA